MNNEIQLEIHDNKVLCKTCKRRYGCICATYCPASIINEPCDNCSDPNCKRCSHYEEGDPE